jgi:hypothetical protein
MHTFSFIRVYSRPTRTCREASNHLLGARLTVAHRGAITPTRVLDQQLQSAKTAIGQQNH